MKRPFIRAILLSPFLLAFLTANALAQGTFVYTNNNTSGANSVTAFSVASSGALTNIGTFATGGSGSSGGFSASNRVRTCTVGNRLYVANDGSNNVSGFDINTTTGALSLVAGSPFATGLPGTAPNLSLDSTPNGQFLIVAGSGSVAVFSIAANGALAPVAGSPFLIGAAAGGIRVSPNGLLLAAAIPRTDRVAVFSIASNGALTPVPGSPFVSPADGAVAGVDIDCPGSFLYATQAGTGTHVDVFSIGANGALTLVQTSNNPGVGMNSSVGVLSPDDQFLFVSNQDSNSVTVFSVAANGMLSLVAGSPFGPTGGIPSGVATNAAGTFVFTADLSSSQVTFFAVAGNGALALIGSFPTGQAGSSGLESVAAFPAKSCCTIACPTDITTCNDGGECGAIVRFASMTTGSCGGVTYSRPSGSFFPVGTTTVTATTETGQSCSFNVTVNDCEAPVVRSRVATSVLWSPNHDLVTVGLNGNATDNCPGLRPIDVMVFGDEDDEERTGDGNHSPDAMDIGLDTLRLRSERKGNGDGRVYLIVLKATDRANNVGFSCRTVVVPHDQSQASLDAVWAQAALAQAFCEANGGAPPRGYFVIDAATSFVRQHYVDFLNRESDTDGLNFWTNEIMSCRGNAACMEVKRVNVSAAFFLSIEFQQTGYLVYRIHKAAFANLPGAPVPIRFSDFLTDTRQIGQGVQVGKGNWQAQLETNKRAYAQAFVQRLDFLAMFPNSMSASQFVTQLDRNAGGVLSAAEKANLVAALGTTPADLTKRASVLMAVAEDSDLRAAEFNKAFVLMQYFGYLRRNPNDAPDADYGGFNFWLNKLNQFRGNFADAEMVKAFIISSEYQRRFGP